MATTAITPTSGRVGNARLPGATVTLAITGTGGDSVEARGFCMFGSVMPSDLDWTSVGYEVSADDTTYQDLYDYTGTIVAQTVAASKSYDLPGALAAWPYWRFKGNASQSPASSILVVAKG